MKRLAAIFGLLLLAHVVSAAVDTRNKRASALNEGGPIVDVYPNPDATIDASDRAHIAGIYSGLDYESGPPSPPGGPGKGKPAVTIPGVRSQL